MNPVLLTTVELAERWQFHKGTLNRWRLIGRGPKFIRLGRGKGSNIAYRLSDIEDYERRMTQTTKESK
jgi:hypothetical protein